jgi:hypothetical protein
MSAWLEGDRDGTALAGSTVNRMNEDKIPSELEPCRPP